MLLTRLERENKNMDKEKLNDIICESSSDYDILNDAYNYIENLETQLKKQKEVIDKAVLELVNIDGNLSNSQLSNRICNLIDFLKKEK